MIIYPQKFQCHLKILNFGVHHKKMILKLFIVWALGEILLPLNTQLELFRFHLREQFVARLYA